MRSRTVVVKVRRSANARVLNKVHGVCFCRRTYGFGDVAQELMCAGVGVVYDKVVVVGVGIRPVSSVGRPP